MTAVEQAGKRPTFMIGIAYGILIIVGGIINYVHLNNYPIIYWFGLLCSFTGIICWIIYWVQLAGQKRALRRIPGVSA
jgi:hypothetical protein